MDDNDNYRSWAYYERPVPSAFKGHLGLQLMPPLNSDKPLLGGRDQHQHYHSANLAAMNGSSPFYHHHRVGVSEPPVHMDYLRNGWLNQGDKYLNLQPSYPENSTQIIQQANLVKTETATEIQEEEIGVEAEGEPHIKSSGSRTHQKANKGKRARATRDESSPAIKRTRTPKIPKKSTEVNINGVDLDISGIPIPVCSCTGPHRQCYRWGSGGWQSACCTTSMSIYPLPMSTKRRGARIAGRKMSLGAFTKVLEKLSSENYDFSNPIDLRTHWARHGTNKFVTIK